MIPLILMAAGTAMSIAGQISSNYAQAAEELENQKYYDQQAKYARDSMLRAEALAESDYTTKLGMQIGAYASGNVDVSGSAAITVGGTIKQAMDEIWAIKQKGDLEFKLARSRGNQSGERGKMLGSTGYNLMQAGTTAIKAYAGSEGFGKGFGTFLTASDAVPSSGGSLKYLVPDNRASYGGYNLGSM